MAAEWQGAPAELDEDVAWVDVAMDDVMRVHVLQARGNVPCQLQDAVEVRHLHVPVVQQQPAQHLRQVAVAHFLHDTHHTGQARQQSASDGVLPWATAAIDWQSSS